MSTSWIASADTSLDVVVGERVHTLMWRTKVSQTALAPKLGLTQGGLSKKLRGERGWSADEIMRVSQIFNASLDYLFGKSESPTPGDPVRPEGLEPPALWV